MSKNRTIRRRWFQHWNVARTLLRGGRAGIAAVCVGWLLHGVAPVCAQDAAETSAFKAAARAFQDGVFERAEREFAEFTQKFPASAQFAEAVLFQARAALKQRKLQGVVDLLTTNAAQAGGLADQYRYWMAEAQFQKADYPAAAETFALLAKDFTNSVRLLEAGYGEALARFRMREWRRAAELLRRPDGAFQQAAKVRANDELVVSGHLLLGEALLEAKEFSAAEQALAGLAEKDLIQEYRWRRQYLLCRVRVAGGWLPEALASTTNLLALAAASGQKNLLAESVALRGGILERLNQLEPAVAVYEQNLLDGTPSEYSRQAMVQVIQLTLAQNKIAEAAQKLTAFLTKHPGDAASDVAFLTLGEVHLRHHLAQGGTNFSAGESLTNTPTVVTNHLQAALGYFDKLISTFTNSLLVPKAQLERGWCLWAEGRIAESLPAFSVAAEKLPASEDQAVARFKLGDAQFFQKDYSNAVQNYRMVIDQFANLPRVKDGLFDHALYQMLRASLALNDLAGATDAMQKILRWYPESFYSDRGLLLVGQSFNAADKPGEARSLFADLVRRIPNSPLLPEVELAIARTHVQENDWAPAIARYDEWVGRYATNALRPWAEFSRAWANYQAGRETNALTLFTNFVAQFPAHELAPRAQYWVATYHYDQKDFVSAEKNFQDKLLFQNSNFVHQARMMAGRAAFARQGWKDARDHFTALVNDNSCPPDLAAEGFFALGDTITRQDADPAKPAARFDEAREAFSKIPLLYATNRLVPRAWGRIGDCYFQMAAQDAKHYDNATNAYRKVLDASVADVSARYQALIGLGQVLERQAQARPAPESAALLKGAFDHYYDILSDAKLRDGEQPDPFWFREAGFAAARLAEGQTQWEVAIGIYRRMGEVLAPLRPALDKKIEKAREHLRPEKG